MFNLNIFNKISSEVLTIKNDLELNSENQLITKYKTSTSEDYKQAIVLIFKERGYTRLEIGQLLREPKATHSHIWDVTSVAMLDSVVNKFQKNGANVTVRGLNEASSIMIDKYGTHARI